MEHISLSELLPEHTKEELKEVENDNVIFMAKVTACKNGIELGTDYLGGCIYECEEDFYIKHKEEHFSDMVETVISESKQIIIALNNELSK